MRCDRWLGALAAALLASALAAPVRAADETLLNVSYDPTRELYEAYNALFAKHSIAGPRSPRTCARGWCACTRPGRR